MKGQYKTPTGELLKVVIFDEENKMVYIENKIGTNKWYHESDYSTWESTEPEKVEEGSTDEVEESKSDKKVKSKKQKQKNDSTNFK